MNGGSSSSYQLYRGKKIEGPRTVLARNDPRFPRVLETIPRPPRCLFTIGDVAALQEGLAVIGARKATPYGLACADRFASLAAAKGIAIISGGAYGCDSAAHKAALSAGGRTVVFFGGGCDHVYPARHLGLFQDIVDSGGVIVSEHEWDFPAQPYTFRERNRLIAGLAKATLIVEAGIPSGTFSTADDALAANKEVMVVPGPITSKTSAGSNRLLLQGATPIVDEESFEDALSWTFGTLKQEAVKREDEDEDDGLLNALRANPLRMEDMLALEEASLGGCDGPAKLTMHLAVLEREGKIARFPDGRYGPASL